MLRLVKKTTADTKKDSGDEDVTLTIIVINLIYKHHVNSCFGSTNILYAIQSITKSGGNQ